MAGTSNVRVAELWQQRLAKFHASGQPATTFCRQEGLSQSSFYLWRKRLSLHKLPQWSKPAPAGFRAVHLMAAASVSVQLPGGTQLTVPMADPESLRLVIDTVARVDVARVDVACVEGVRPC